MWDENHIKGLITAQLALQGQPRMGIVTSVNPADYTCKVMIQPDGVETGWLPMGALCVGGVSIVAPLISGQQVVVVPDSGDAEHGITICGAFSGVDAPPTSPITGQPVQSGEFGIFCPGGAYLHVAGGKFYLAGDLHVAGDIYDKVGKLDGLRQHYDQHTHIGVQPGGGISGTTTAPDP